MNLSDEWFPVVDEDGNEVGRARRHVCHDGRSFLLHPVVHLHLLNSDGRLFLQKRSATKDVQPGKWDTSVGGHISPGESPGEAVLREASEELGISGIRPVFLGRYVWKSPVERELVSSFLVISDVLPVINKDEIEEGRYWSVVEIEESMGKDIFTPNFEHEFTVVLSGKI
jgi:isopentenyldiphosphate isomerase